MGISVGMVSLGCNKNQVDAERLMYLLRERGYLLKEDPAMADIVIVNTCGFIQSAKEEAIETILEFCKLKKEGRIKKVLVTGCLAERYKSEVAEEIPEIDAVVGIGANGDICRILDEVLAVPPKEKGWPLCTFEKKELLPLDGGRVLSTLPFYGYLKIAEGCDNRCSYCAIPMIRGQFRSKPQEALVEEARWMADQGVKELVVVAQDTTRYGEDLYGRLALPELLKKLCAVEGIEWIRLLYCYPERVTDELLEVMAKEPKILKYMDIPLQHCDSEILKRMNRRISGEKIRELMEHIRKAVPGIVLRTTLIAGFPGETDEQFTSMAEFVRDMKFERLGCFAYSKEENTPAAAMTHQVEEKVKQRRADQIMEMQMMVSDQYNKRQEGKVLTVMVEGFDRYAECYFGRTSADAPDIDGKVFFTTGEELDSEKVDMGIQPLKLKSGTFVQVKITGAMDYDLLGELVE